MYLNLGQEVLRRGDIVGIFDLDTSTVQKKTRDYLSRAEKAGEVETLGEDLPRAFVVENRQGSKKQRIYLSQLSHTTLLKRMKDVF